MQQLPSAVFSFSSPLAAVRRQARKIMSLAVATASGRMRGPSGQLRCCGTYCCQG